LPPVFINEPVENSKKKSDQKSNQMKITGCLFFSLLLFVGNGWAQENIQKLLSFNTNFYPIDLKADHDGNLLCSFSDYSSGGSIPGIMKLDTSFNILWASEQQFANPVNQFWFCVTPDNGVVTAAIEDLSYPYHGIITRLDAFGNVLWSKITHSDFATEIISSVVCMPSGNLLVCGGESGQTAIMKLDANGNILWKKKTSSSGLLISIIITPSNDNNYYLSGAVSNGSQPLIGVVMKIDSDGEVLWVNRFADTQQSPLVSSLAAGSDNSYFFTLDDGNSDTIVVVKAVSTVSIPFASPRYHLHARQTYSSVAVNNDGTILVLGSTYDSLQLNTGRDLILSTVSVDGSAVNTERYEAGGNEFASAMIILNNSAYLAGTSYSSNYDSSFVYLVKHKVTNVINCNAENYPLIQPSSSFLSGDTISFTVDSSSILLNPVSNTNVFITPVIIELCVETGMEDLASAKPQLLNVFPNPSNGLFFFSGKEDFKQLPYNVRDLSGRIISTGKLKDDSTLDLRDQPPGVYVITIIGISTSYVDKLIRL
jgi:hypothetical protein